MVEMDGAVGVGGGGQAPAPAPHPRLWRLVDERCDPRALETDYVRRFHRHEPREHQCSSAVAKHIKAPVHLVSAPLNLFLFFMPLNILISAAGAASSSVSWRPDLAGRADPPR